MESWILQLMPIRNEYMDGSVDEPMDGDDVDELCKTIKAKLNYHEGNIDEREYNRILDSPRGADIGISKLNRDDVNDLAVLITGDLVLEGLVKDCTDTDDETEFEFQDCIVEAIIKGLTNIGKYENIHADGSKVDE